LLYRFALETEMHAPKQTMSNTILGRKVPPLGDLRPTPVAAGNPYGAGQATARQWVSAFMTSMVSEGRLCGLQPSEWSMLLIGVALCGVATLLF
jgi:hypothetical protein